jgi:hypothetical protein
MISEGANVIATRTLLAIAGLLLTSAAYAADGTAADLQSNNIGWVAMNQDLAPVPGEIPPSTSDKAHPFVPNGRGAQPTFRIGDISNPNLKPWAAAQMKKDNEEVLAGKIAFTARSSCMPAGVPGFSSFIVEPVYFIQSPKEVLVVYAGNQEARHILMNVPHTKNPKPSWYGESVGHYEGDTMVVDTIGLNNKTYVDNYRTPHSEKLHVVERYRLVEDGRVLETKITADDPDTFNKPWSALQRYRRVQQGPLDEQVCAENNNGVFDYHIPIANRPDF